MKGLSKQRKTPLAAMKRTADKLAGAKCRSRGFCEACGKLDGLQWCHIFSRRYQAIRWDMFNCKCLCSGCHFKYTMHPDLWMEYMVTRHPEQLNYLIEKKNQAIKIDRFFMEQVLEGLK